MRASVLLALLALACGPKAAAPEVLAKRPVPGPLAQRPFVMPEVQRAVLSNGLEVRVVPNTEVPLWQAWLVLDASSDDDPIGKEGLASVTMDMLDEGVVGASSEELAAELKRLGGSLGAGADSDGASLGVSGPRRNLEPLLDLWAKVLRKPTFPEEDWRLMQDRRIAGLQQALENPRQIAGRVRARLAWGDAYQGRLTTEASYRAITPADMRAFHATRLRPDRALLLVGGDVSLDELVPLLEARLADWVAPGQGAPARPAPTPAAFEAATIYVVDKPGAAQTELSAFLPVGRPTDPDHYAFYMGNTVLGGAFTARMNMNLREDKGYTYGARCGAAEGKGPSLWTCSASVATGVTLPAFREMQREITEILGSRPVSTDELAFFEGYRVNGFLTSYETPSEMLGELQRIWAQDLPEDWLERYVPGVQAVTPETAQAALARHIQPERLAFLMVGDLASFRDELPSLGLPVVIYDRDANPVEVP